MIVLIGSLLLISAKIKYLFYSSAYDNANFCVLALGICFGYKVACWSVVISFRRNFRFACVCRWRWINLLTRSYNGLFIWFLFATLVAGFFKYDIFKDPILNFLINFLSKLYLYLWFSLAWKFNWYGINHQVFDLGAKPFLLIETYKILIFCHIIKTIF